MATGSFAVLIVMGMLIPKFWLPIVAFLLEVFVWTFVRQNRESELPTCYKIPFMATRILFWTGVIMLLINYLYVKGWILRLYTEEQINRENPFITLLILSTVSTAVCLWVKMRGQKLRFCVDCTLRNGTGAERGFLGIIYAQEGRFQTRLLLYCSVAMMVVGWAYYAFCYINVNMNRPDRFFFNWLPLIFIFSTWVYMGVRYSGVWSYYCNNEGLRHDSAKRTRVRFLIISGDKILLKKEDELDSPTPLDRYDTPVSLSLAYRERVTLLDAENLFREYSKVRDFEIRFMYSGTTANADCNLFHFIVTLPAESETEGSRLKGEWFTIRQVEQMINNRRTAPLFSAEIVRLYTVTMAWKTYDRTGKRLYKIKNYRPTFRLRDIGQWDVDFDDPQWLLVAQNNEDSNFWRLRRFWQRKINGTGE